MNTAVKMVVQNKITLKSVIGALSPKEQHELLMQSHRVSKKLVARYNEDIIKTL